ncbi:MULTISPECIES: DUF2970 domain-containing protein [Rheinheimera]|uniref:DUF2970 domain-containing protein n=1 Tax=Rheinheimera marina TaxID=1774958 RepID=A0ABV9JN23_9GAMM
MAGPTLKQLGKAIIGALIGVQSEQQRQADFQQHSMWPYLIAGILATALFVGMLLLIVTAVLS